MTAVVGVVGDPGLGIAIARVSLARGGHGSHGTSFASVVDGEVGGGGSIRLIPVVALVGAVNQ